MNCSFLSILLLSELWEWKLFFSFPPHFTLPSHHLSSFPTLVSIQCVVFILSVGFTHCIWEAILLSKVPIHLLTNRVEPQILFNNTEILENLNINWQSQPPGLYVILSSVLVLNLDFYSPSPIAITILYSLCSNFSYIYHFPCSLFLLIFHIFFLDHFLLSWNISFNQQLLEDNTQLYICLKMSLFHPHSAMWGYIEKSAVCNPKEGPHQILIILVPSPWTSSLQNCEKWISLVYKLPSLW